jgi:hypothetical protein
MPFAEVVTFTGNIYVSSKCKVVLNKATRHEDVWRTEVMGSTYNCPWQQVLLSGPIPIAWMSPRTGFNKMGKKTFCPNTFLMIRNYV